jgi:hypothetical protein
MKVYVALYENSHWSSEIRVFATEAGARTWKAQIADENWSTQFSHDRRPKPADRDEMANAYFHEHQDRGASSFTLEECDIDGAVAAEIR